MSRLLWALYGASVWCFALLIGFTMMFAAMLLIPVVCMLTVAVYVMQLAVTWKRIRRMRKG